ncbi:MAG: hypothetical protein JW969_15790 [Spirochaetales bacterium]|nr:hypothetical protein [Spirochaetales bacterium]
MNKNRITQIILTFLVGFFFSCDNGLLRDLVEEKVTGPSMESFVIEYGASYINHWDVTLSSAVPRAIEMRFRNEADPWSVWTEYSVNYTWNLSALDGLKTVYAEFRDEGYHTVTSSDQINVNSSLPGSPQFTVNTTTSPTTDQTPVWEWQSGLDPADYAGIFRYDINNSDLSSAQEVADTSYTPGSALSDGTYILYVQEKNTAGTWSPINSRAIEVDTIGPAVPVVTGTSPTTDTTPTWSWSVTPNDVSEYQYSLDGGAWTSIGTATSFTPGSSLTIAVHTLEVQARDLAGNWSGIGSLAITVVGIPDINLKFGATNIVNNGSLNLGYIPLNKTRDFTLTVENTGTDTLTLNGPPLPPVIIGGTDASIASIPTQPLSTIAASATSNFTVRFTSTTKGNKSITLTIASDDPDENPYLVTLTATCVWQGTAMIDGSLAFLGMDCDIAVSGDSVYVSYINDSANAALFNGSQDGGETWSGYKIVSMNASTVYSPGSLTGRNSAIATDGSNIYFVYRDALDLYCYRSSNQGASWSACNGGFPIYGFTAPGGFDAATDGSAVIILYQDTALYPRCALSTDAGNTWTDGAVFNGSDCGYQPSLYLSGNNLYIAYHEYFAGVMTEDLQYHFSSNKGATWTAGNRLPIADSDKTGYYSSIAASGSYRFIAYYNATSTSLEFIWSDNSLSTSSTYVLDSSSTAVGKWTSMAMDGSTINLSYYDEANGDLKFYPLYNYGQDRNPSNIRTVDSAGDVGMYSSIAVNGSIVYICYWDKTNGDVKIAKSIDGGLTW